MSFVQNSDPLEYFSNWFVEPISPVDRNVLSVLDAINRLPWTMDVTAPYYVMPPNRYHEKPGRIGVFSECQEVFTCFVYEDDANRADAPVYYTAPCIDLAEDAGIPAKDVINGDHFKLCDDFQDFIWFMLGSIVCLREKSNGLFSKDVNGILFNAHLEGLDDVFEDPLVREFPTGLQSLIWKDAICISSWGAVFQHTEARNRFVERYDPPVVASWP